MADNSVEKETKPADPVAAVDATANSEPTSPAAPYDDDVDPEEDIRRAEEDEEKRAEREEMKRTQSYATDTSVLTRTTTRQSTPVVQKKPWYKTPNPLRWGDIPPVPEKRGPSREYNASWWSLLTFQWMAPLMSVRLPSSHPQHNCC
jgi:ATP-binding cassette, subfamily C (CFTR/MRP), member 1